MLKANYLASFIGMGARKATFAGLFEVGASRLLTRKQFWEMPAHQELKTFGMRGVEKVSERETTRRFDLTLTGIYAEWKGRLIVSWAPPELSWWRRADRNVFPVFAIREESAFDAAMPSWEAVTLGWEQLRVLPTSWRNKLSEWRAIYFIFDTSDGKGYVGSAYGAETLLGRWLGYGDRGHGGNVLLRRRDPHAFRFSILQRGLPRHGGGGRDPAGGDVEGATAHAPAVRFEGKLRLRPDSRQSSQGDREWAWRRGCTGHASPINGNPVLQNAVQFEPQDLPERNEQEHQTNQTDTPILDAAENVAPVFHRHYSAD